MTNKSDQSHPEHAPDWLAQEFSLRKTKNPKYSLRAFANHLNLPASRVSEYISRKRRITLKMADKIADKLNYIPEKREKFFKAVERDLQPIQSTMPARVKAGKLYDQFHLICDWFNLAILSLIRTKTFKSNYQWISKRLAISVVEVKSTIERLSRLGLIKVEKKDDSELKFTRTSAPITTSKDIPSSAIRIFQKQILAKSILAVDEVPVDMRDISSIVIPFNPKDIDDLKKELSTLRRSLASKYESEDGEEVYALSVQFFPLTKIK